MAVGISSVPTCTSLVRTAPRFGIGNAGALTSGGTLTVGVGALGRVVVGPATGRLPEALPGDASIVTTMPTPTNRTSNCRRIAVRVPALTIASMKYVVCVPDGASDEPLDELGGRTPLEV